MLIYLLAIVGCTFAGSLLLLLLILFCISHLCKNGDVSYFLEKPQSRILRLVSSLPPPLTSCLCIDFCPSLSSMRAFNFSLPLLTPHCLLNFLHVTSSSSGFVSDWYLANFLIKFVYPAFAIKACVYECEHKCVIIFSSRMRRLSFAMESYHL